MSDKLIDTTTNIRQDTDGLWRTTQQEIPDSYLSQLAEERNDNGMTKSGEMMKMASIPVVVVEEMAKQGLDVYKAPIKDIIKWLKNNEMGHFITSDKRI
tara:strand:+ start:930 stop:1226 length:297 start_codon:yes stop_codon:yes gene_type:complete